MFKINDFKGRVAVITGGASGIGYALAQRFVQEGIDVVISDINEMAVKKAADQLNVTGIHSDVADADSVQRLADAVMQKYGKIDILVNNAGVGSMGFIKDLTLKDWQWMIQVNLFGVIHGIHSFLPLLKQNPQGGFVINTSSMAGITTDPGMAMGAYTVTKMGVVGLSRILQKELESEGENIGVSVLCPGPVKTQISQGLTTRTEDSPTGFFDIDASQDGVLASLRWMQPIEVADLVIEAIQQGQPYIVTHPELWPVVESHHRSIASAFA